MQANTAPARTKLGVVNTPPPITLAGAYRMPLRRRLGRWLRDLAMRWLP